MKKQAEAFVLLAILSLTLVVLVPFCAAQSLSPPTVVLPSDWALQESIPYPESTNYIHDSGAGELLYTNTEGSASVFVFYENALGITYSNSALTDEAVNIYNLYESKNITIPMTDSGTMPLAGTTAGYAKGNDSTANIYEYSIVLVKGTYYIDIFVVYPGDPTIASQISSLIDSISVSTSSSNNNNDALIGGIIILIIIVLAIAVAVLLVNRRKTKKQTRQQNQIHLEPVLITRTNRIWN